MRTTPDTEPRPKPLTPSEVLAPLVLLLLAVDGGELTPAEIADELGETRLRVSASLRHVEREGSVSRRGTTNSSRHVFEATPDGRERAARALQPPRAFTS